MVPAEGTLLVLLSGGASALLAAPAGDLTLDDKAHTTSALLRSGADIVALNTVRKHLSAVKGGWLAASTKATCRALVISDVVGDDVSVIGSGPTVPDSSTFAEALEILRRFGGEAVYPPRVVQYLQAGADGAVPETPKPGDPRLARTSTSVVATRLEAMDGAAREGGRRGYHVARLDEPVVGEARLAAQAYLQNLMQTTLRVDRPICLLSSGETTVRVTGSGMGGRNQEFALAAVPTLATWSRPSVLASVGTDGIDGPTDAAGALVSTTTSARAIALGLAAPADYLERNDAYRFLNAVGDLVRTGPTGTNVGDLQVLLLGANRQSTSPRLRTGQ
jgi:hydroxypyruvate reductase